MIAIQLKGELSRGKKRGEHTVPKKYTHRKLISKRNTVHRGVQAQPEARPLPHHKV